ncbi:DUF1766-domain-containing protein [Myriangium duriaei CBS 260.36]|uniref:DUF1766-domain-containing protein n=1 Tax=Myriangium duriaei CBS 260.36 TaxID=1168546 RepID=A0A9P4J2H4_9PEZI|nr:DUF1766-domain-containing protein [Myriangium duriaei CBS 260.36]
MAFNLQTPESLLGRSDSKNPATTCRGLTTAGKPCRRALAATPSQKGSHLQPGVVAVLEGRNGSTLDAAFFCWQHKDQAHQAIARSATPESLSTRLVTVTERTSIDSLVERLGVAHLADAQVTTKHADKRTRRQPRRNPTVPSNSHLSQREPQEVWPAQMKYERPASASRHREPRRRPAQPNFFASLCCLGGSRDEDDYYEIVRHRQKSTAATTQHHQDASLRPSRSAPPSYNQESHMQPAPQRPQMAMKPLSTSHPPPVPRQPLASLPPMAINRIPHPSPTKHYLAHIPPHVSPSTASSLLSELSKPISPHDVEGYIYIFWLTSSSHVPDRDLASSLLDTNDSNLARMNGLVRNHSIRETKGRKTILLKIGRANNVHRRMTEWTQQCGYALSLLRWYPYVGTPRSSPVRGPRAREGSEQVRKVPHVHRVERLIHLELADKRVKRDCGACGKEHREWFEIEASMEGVRGVDEAVRRWVKWAEESV